jgi:hypothetical protein
VLLAVVANLANAQPQGGKGHRMGPPRRMNSPNGARERWNAMPPEDRQIFRKNAERWMQMGPEEQKVMREREKLYRERVKREIDAAIRDSGLRLEGEKREQFEQRYLQERRRIEHALRQETESKRQQELPALQEKLKKEFQEPSSPTTNQSAPASSSPKK